MHIGMHHQNDRWILHEGGCMWAANTPVAIVGMSTTMLRTKPSNERMGSCGPAREANATLPNRSGANTRTNGIGLMRSLCINGIIASSPSLRSASERLLSKVRRN